MQTAECLKKGGLGNPRRNYWSIFQIFVIFIIRFISNEKKNRVSGRVPEIRGRQRFAFSCMYVTIFISFNILGNLAAVILDQNL